MLARFSARAYFSALFLLCAGLLGFGLYLQHAVGLEPCPMCIMQRYALALVGIVALIGALHGPGFGAARVYAGLVTLLALAGGGVAARQSWMQLNPPEFPECGPGLEFMLESFGLAETLPMIFRGAGDCSAVDWTFLGLSIANWSLLNFALIAVAGLFLLFRKQPRRWY
ncbi:disulfide bond formation protein B [Pseudothauera nasutitermitis]|uniref:Disulfide bond formation protein B n=1 Tax=Pseudothauera nasutitermitis TaxID=2565930 RepID=A0A4S4AXM8_9RHOO|nr:disulfide bond formation protein B [Pseudothauera nasutitermitis]THF64065.1 disulfide bond formation protein B [Pseudothauera nasutitermitis]